MKFIRTLLDNVAKEQIAKLEEELRISKAISEEKSNNINKLKATITTLKSKIQELESNNTYIAEQLADFRHEGPNYDKAVRYKYSDYDRDLFTMENQYIQELKKEIDFWKDLRGQSHIHDELETRTEKKSDVTSVSFTIKGTNYRKDNLEPGTYKARLVPEKNNAYDPYAVKIVSDTREVLGYVPAGNKHLHSILKENKDNKSFPITATLEIEINYLGYEILTGHAVMDVTMIKNLDVNKLFLH